MQESNPYAAPSADLAGKESFGESVGGVTNGVVDQLARTKGWTRFNGVCLILSGVGLLWVAFFFVPVALDRHVGMAGAVRYAVMAIYGIFAALYFVAGAKLQRFSSAISELLASGKESDLEEVLDRQRKFWRYAGILAIVGVVFGALAVLGSLVSSR